MIVVETLGAEDLDLGTSTATKTHASGGTYTVHEINLSTLAINGPTGGAVKSTWAPGTVAAGGIVSTSVTVAGAAIGDMVMVSHDKILATKLQPTGVVSAANTVDVVIANLTGSPVTLASGSLRVMVFHVPDAA